MARRLLPVLADVVVAAADIIRECRSRDRVASAKAMALTEHERRCVLRYRGRLIAQRCGVMR